MEIETLLTPLIKPFVYFVIFSIFVAVIKSAWFKGKLGEFKVNLLLKLFLNKAQYHLIKNVTLPTFDESGQHSGTTQVDHIVVSAFGVFVIETKHFKGWIFGSEFQKQWTQQIYKHKSRFQNPLLQNYKHCKTIENLLGLDGTDKQDKTKRLIKSLVVFTGSAEFKTELPTNVCYDSKLIKTIKGFKTQLLDAQQVAKIIEQIESGRLKRGFVTDKQHAEHVKVLVKDSQSRGGKRDSQRVTQRVTSSGKHDRQGGLKRGSRVGSEVVRSEIARETSAQD
ncbi:nuclease-related domain-containing protein [Marinicellulosiphila megalodicopiae]|uniref:nuclease-related domain-containing protein n=1 Tax=Marinicellulosiphila megalodicopiae TaxID=2724896 RepID=UPI003BB1999A